MVTFLSLFALVLSKIPMGFIANPQNYPYVTNIPFNNIYYSETIFGGNLSISDSHNVQVNTGNPVTFNIPPSSPQPTKVNVYYMGYYGPDSYRISIYHEYTIFYVIPWSSEATPEISLLDVLNHVTPTNENQSYIIVHTDEPKTFHVLLTFNTHLYANFTEAWDAGYMNMTIGYPVSSSLQGTDVFSILGNLLFFRGIEVGIDPLVNTVIALPIWVSFGYLLFRFIHAIIPFLSGF